MFSFLLEIVRMQYIVFLHSQYVFSAYQIVMCYATKRLKLRKSLYFEIL